ncbi:hypothetical protein BH20CHL8_BH20CHL8_07440 [soil metagenome]
MVITRRGTDMAILLLRPTATGLLAARLPRGSQGSASLRSAAKTMNLLSELAQGWRLLGILNLMSSEVVGAPREARHFYARVPMRGICSGGLPSLGRRR